jgi:hypothetical protein
MRWVELVEGFTTIVRDGAREVSVYWDGTIVPGPINFGVLVCAIYMIVFLYKVFR